MSFGSHLPILCPSLVNVGIKKISAGDDHSMVLGKDGSVWAAGLNDCGQLGDGTTKDRKNFVLIIGMPGAT